MHFRSYTKDDAGVLAQVLFDAIRKGPSPYTINQRSAWMPSVPDTAAFASRLKPLFVVVAEAHGKPVGFVGVSRTGYIDLVFILHRYRGTGAFRNLYEMVETHVRKNGLIRLSTHASLSAQPAFRAMGFSVIQHESVTCDVETLHRAEMEKRLI